MGLEKLANRFGAIATQPEYGTSEPAANTEVRSLNYHTQQHL
jgi:tRNA G10  N-methylase Trm11